MGKRRIACLVMPHFLVEVCLRSNPSLAGRPIAIAEGASRREIAGASANAVGVRVGMTPKQARAACPGLVVVARDEAAERAAIAELLDALETCGPNVEGRAPGLCFFDAANLPAGEAGTLGAAMAVAQALGFASAAAVADDKFTAHCAALIGGRGATVVPPGGSTAFLQPLPMTLLPLAPGDADRFDLLGLRTIGQIAALPSGPLAARFGERAREYAMLARGKDDEPLRPRRSQEIYEERFAFDGTIDRLEPLLFALRGCIADLTARLSGAAQVCDKVELILDCLSIPVMLAEPTASAVTIFDLVRIALESRENLGEIESVIVRAAPCGLPPPQLTLFDGASTSRRAALAATLARLRATLDADEVVVVEPTATRSRLPERMQRTVPVASPQQMMGELRSPSYTASSKAWAPALRLVSPPKPIEAPQDTAACAGPFRLSESWWERPVDRDYYQLMDRAGGLLLVFRDLCDGKWYLQGVFD
jgi:protein ImuB